MEHLKNNEEDLKHLQTYADKTLNPEKTLTPKQIEELDQLEIKILEEQKVQKLADFQGKENTLTED